MTSLATLIFDFHQVISALTTLIMTLTLSRVKTGLQKDQVKSLKAGTSNVDRIRVVIRSLSIDIAKASQVITAVTTPLLQSNIHCRNCKQENQLTLTIFFFFVKRALVIETLIESSSGELQIMKPLKLQFLIFTIGLVFLLC